MNNDKEVDNKFVSEDISEWQLLIAELERSYAVGNVKTAGHLFYDFQQSTSPWLLAIAKSGLPSEEDAQDAVAEVFMNLHEHLEKGKSVRYVKAFLRTLMTRRIADILRKPREVAEFMNDLADEQGNVPQELIVNPYTKVDKDMVFRSLKNALLEKVPSPEREILILRHYHGLSVEETASRLNITVDIVKKKTRSAKSIAFQIAKEQGIEL